MTKASTGWRPCGAGCRWPEALDLHPTLVQIKLTFLSPLAILHPMSDVVLSFRGRQVRAADVLFLRELIAQNPALSRSQLSLKVCLAW
ncbi:MAG: hypothetical protein O2960_10250, partial [Verrucomicrobia bacterium]|nr:hypothetical protein [Verrucomicrobiota bacterium]